MGPLYSLCAVYRNLHWKHNEWWKNAKWGQEIQWRTNRYPRQTMKWVAFCYQWWLCHKNGWENLRDQQFTKRIHLDHFSLVSRTVPGRFQKCLHMYTESNLIIFWDFEWKQFFHLPSRSWNISLVVNASNTVTPERMPRSHSCPH